MKRHKQEQANMADLPSEIIEDILLKLPVKSLIRFRCVSKSWHSLITHPRFVRMHVNHNLTNGHHNSLILQFRLPNWDTKIAEVGVSQKEEKEITQSPIDLPYIVSPRHYYIVKGCCDGILCIIQDYISVSVSRSCSTQNGGIQLTWQSRLHSSTSLQDYDTLVLWNPRIGDCKRLAVPESFAGTSEVIGLGYDSSIDDYKVVRGPLNFCRNHRFPNSTVVEVLTLKSNSWRRLYDDFPFSIAYSQHFICANGGIYWFANDATRPRFTILFFDLKEEKFNEVPLPTGVVAEADKISSLANLGGCLCMLSGMILNRRLDLWVMNGGTWLKLVTIPNLSGLDSKSWMIPFSLTKDGAVLMILGDRKFVTYEPKDNILRNSLLI